MGPKQMHCRHDRVLYSTVLSLQNDLPCELKAAKREYSVKTETIRFEPP